MVSDDIKKAIEKATGEKDIKLEHPVDLAYGDFSTNIAMKLKKDPKEIVKRIGKIEGVEKIEVAGNGFINFYLTKDFYTNSIKEILEEGENFGKNKKLKNQKTIIEYTDPNPFKEFHIGHLMSNTIGESIARLYEWNGAEVKRANYQGDVGMHVAKAVWGMKELNELENLGKAYAHGAKKYEEDKLEIEKINKQIYGVEEMTDEIKRYYEIGRKKSLEYFETIYKKLGTKFDYYFFESETKDVGEEVAKKFLDNGVLVKGEKGAIIFEGEKYGLHTRVFRSSEGIPTYEAKELGLAKIKYEKYKYDKSIIITANEINEYFKVLLKVMSLDDEDGETSLKTLAEKTKHIGHGFLRLPEGKMSSRTGDVVTFESIYDKVFKKIQELTKEKDLDNESLEKIAIATLKYSILKQGMEKDIIFDLDKSVSFEGDSGPYLQYTYVRAKSILEQAKANKNISFKENLDEISNLEKLLYRFPEIVERAGKEFAPNYIATYLTEIASAFNSYYANNKILDSKNEKYRLALAQAVSIVIKNGLEVLGIGVPEKM